MIKYDFTPKDLAEFNHYYIRHHASFLVRNSRYFYILILIIFFFNLRELIFTKEYWSNPSFATLVPMVLLVTFVVFIFKRRNFFAKRAVDRFVKRNPQVFGHQEITLTEDKLIIQKDGSRSEHSYGSLMGLTQDDQYYFIFMNTNSAIVIPKVAVTETSDKEILESKIKTFQKR